MNFIDDWGLKSAELTTTDVWYQKNWAPTFNQLFQERQSTAASVPDTLNKKTAIGSAIYSKTLESQMASLNFNVQCWGANSSYIFGFENQGSGYDKITTSGILAASSETYQLRSTAILPDEFSVDKTTLPVIPRGAGISSRLPFRQELIADDLHSELIAAYANQLSIIPYKCFDTDHRSFAPNATDIFIGIGPQRISIIGETEEQHLFSSDEISLIGIPAGAVFDSMARLLTWDPTEDQLGHHKLLISATSPDGKRGCFFNMTLQVSYPSVALPFKVQNGGVSIVNESTGLVVIWENAGDSGNYFCPEGSKDCRSVMSLVRVHDQPQLIVTKYFDFFLLSTS